MTRPLDPITSARWRALLGDDFDRWYAEAEAAGSVDVDRFLNQLILDGKVSYDAWRRAAMVRGVPFVTGQYADHDPKARFRAEGPFLLLGEIGRGAQAKVHVSRDVTLGRKVAYKELLDNVSPRARRRFIAEAQITAQLDHPNIVPVYALREEEGGKLGYAMKLVEGRALSEVLREARNAAPTTSEEEVSDRARRLEVFIRVCEAVAYAHARGVVHRDLKPSNVMIGPYGEVYVMDWGLARVVSDADADGTEPIGGTSSPDETQAGDIIGTPIYMAPEQARGETWRLGPKSDQYTLGVILQELVTLSPAVLATSGKIAVSRAQGAQREAMVHVRPENPIPADLVAIVARATDLDPERRYADVLALADDVRAFLRGDATAALPDTRARALLRSFAHNQERLFRGLVVAALLIALAFLGVVVAGLSRTVSVQRAEAALREELADAGRDADAFEARMIRFAAIAESLGAAATIVLQHAPEEGPAPLTLADLGAPELRPDVRRSAAYGRPISLDRPVLLEDGPAAAASRLTRLRDDYQRALLRSATDGSLDFDAAARWRMIGEEGVPVRRLHVALDGGPHVAYPAMVPVDVPAPAAQTNWYKAAANQRFMHWRTRRVTTDRPSIVTVSRSIFGAGGTGFLGVVAVEVNLDPGLLEHDPGELVWVFDETGRTLVGSPGAGDPPVAVRAAVGLPEVTRVDDPDAGGSFTLIPLETLGWTYAIGRR